MIDRPDRYQLRRYDPANWREFPLSPITQQVEVNETVA